MKLTVGEPIIELTKEEAQIVYKLFDYFTYDCFDGCTITELVDCFNYCYENPRLNGDCFNLKIVEEKE